DNTSLECSGPAVRHRTNQHVLRQLICWLLRDLWYVMGAIYIFTAAVIAAKFEPRFAQPAVFGYAIFLFVLWATTALGTGAGLDTVAYVDKAIEALLVVNMALLIRSSRSPNTLS